MILLQSEKFYVSVTIFFLLIIIELTIRYFHLADYILYSRSPTIGYVPLPNSSGVMRRRYRWHINSWGLRSDSDKPVDYQGIVLVGDSIVEGGAMVDQNDTLGHHLSQAIQMQVYPVGGGGWSLPNELAYLEAYNQLLHVQNFVFVINGADLVPMNTWKTKSTHPTSPPISQLIYLASRLIWKVQFVIRERIRARTPPREDGSQGDEEWMQLLARFLEKYHKSLVFVLYPDRSETASGLKPCGALRPLVSDRAIRGSSGTRPSLGA